MIYKIENIYGVNVSYTDETHGGGIPIYPDFITILKDRYPNKIFNNCLEWCAGPGFIGFAILSKNICRHLTLIDLYQPAVDAVSFTISNNELTDKVSVYLSNNFDSVPLNKFDLIVANPPHYNTDVYAKHLSHWEHTGKRIYQDINWNTHRNFFKAAKDYITDDGKILLIENIRGSSEETFKDIIDENGLEITGHFFSPTMKENYWYLEVSNRT